MHQITHNFEFQLKKKKKYMENTKVSLPFKLIRVYVDTYIIPFSSSINNQNIQMQSKKIKLQVAHMNTEILLMIYHCCNNK